MFEMFFLEKFLQNELLLRKFPRKCMSYANYSTSLANNERKKRKEKLRNWEILFLRKFLLLYTLFLTCCGNIKYEMKFCFSTIMMGTIL